jgi:hypothetical protein
VPRAGKRNLHSLRNTFARITLETARRWNGSQSPLGASSIMHAAAGLAGMGRLAARKRRLILAGATNTITAPIVEELETKVREWYEQAAGQGLEDARMPWDPELVQETKDGFAFNVWAHS